MGGSNLQTHPANLGLLPQATLADLSFSFLPIARHSGGKKPTPMLPHALEEVLCRASDAMEARNYPEALDALVARPRSSISFQVVSALGVTSSGPEAVFTISELQSASHRLPPAASKRLEVVPDVSLEIIEGQCLPGYWQWRWQSRAPRSLRFTKGPFLSALLRQVAGNKSLDVLSMNAGPLRAKRELRYQQASESLTPSLR